LSKEFFVMGKKHFSEEQIAFALGQAESGTAVAEILRKLANEAPADERAGNG